MALQYVTTVASKANPWANRKQEPLLTDEDEAFLHKITSNGEEHPAGPERMLIGGNDAQIALMDGAQEIPLPISPTGGISREIEEPEESQKPTSPAPTAEEKEKSVEKTEKKKKRRPWSWISRRRSSDVKKQEKDAAATSLSEIATKSKTPDGEAISEHEQQEEQEDMTALLEQLNLAAVNNRAFSISDETQELLQKFKLIFKDLVTGVPTAYHDLESLLTNGDKQLRDSFGHLPSFLKKLIEKLPEQLTEHLGPEFLAVAGEKPSQSGLNMGNAGKAAAAAKKMGLRTPNLKELVAKPTALASMLRSIIGFLRARFPAVLGMNVLWSLALFILLYVLWYCHKRGKEVRLENERLVTEAEVEKMNEEFDRHIRPTETLNTTAPRDASIEDVHAGVQAVQRAREEAALQDSEADGPPTLASVQTTTSTPQSPTPGPSKKHPEVQPYEGT